MGIDQVWLRALRQQASIVQSAKLDLNDSLRSGFKVAQAEMALRSVEGAYHRLLTDAPRAVVVRHLRERIMSVYV